MFAQILKIKLKGIENIINTKMLFFNILIIKANKNSLKSLSNNEE